MGGHVGQQFGVDAGWSEIVVVKMASRLRTDIGERGGSCTRARGRRGEVIEAVGARSEISGRFDGS